MRIRVKALLSTIVAAFAAYLIELSGSHPLSVGILVVLAIAVTTYLVSEHLIPIFERWWNRKQVDGQPVFRVEGLWWEIQSAHPHIKIAAVNVRYNTETERISLDGIAYNDDGTEGAIFRSLASVLLPERREIFYQWEGNLWSEKNIIMTGVGTMAFNAVERGPFREGMGDYIEFATGNRPMCLVQLSLIRFTQKEEEAWESGDLKISKKHCH